MKTWQALLLAVVLLFCAVALAASRRYYVDVRQEGAGVILYRTDTLTGRIEMFAYGEQTKGKWVRIPVTEGAEARGVPKAQP